VVNQTNVMDSRAVYAQQDDLPVPVVHKQLEVEEVKQVAKPDSQLPSLNKPELPPVAFKRGSNMQHDAEFFK
jgi:hypothetical protein